MMSERKWAQGPWVSVTEDIHDNALWTVVAGDDGSRDVTTMSHFGDIENAHLIAAAPDLYDALKAMVDYCNAECGSKIYPGHQANQALAKARGEPQ